MSIVWETVNIGEYTIILYDPVFENDKQVRSSADNVVIKYIRKETKVLFPGDEYDFFGCGYFAGIKNDSGLVKLVTVNGIIYKLDIETGKITKIGSTK